jgi:hypothetical protein
VTTGLMALRAEWLSGTARSRSRALGGRCRHRRGQRRARIGRNNHRVRGRRDPRCRGADTAHRPLARLRGAPVQRARAARLGNARPASVRRSTAAARRVDRRSRGASGRAPSPRAGLISEVSPPPASREPRACAGRVTPWSPQAENRREEVGGPGPRRLWLARGPLRARPGQRPDGERGAAPRCRRVGPGNLIVTCNVGFANLLTGQPAGSSSASRG